MSYSVIGDLPSRLGERVTVTGWLTGLRSSGKIAFLQLRDGSGFVQGVLVKQEVEPSVFTSVRSLPQESSVKVTGLVREDVRSPSGVELGVEMVEVVSLTSDYPISPKEHGVDFLMDHRHLHLRHRAPWAIMRIRDELARGITDFFSERAFLRFDAPLFMPTAVEGTTNLFEIKLSEDEQAYLSQSGQLYAEAGALAFGKVYTFGPTFRAEKSKTRRHLLEFWMVEPEVAFMEHRENMELQEQLLVYLVKRVVRERGTELALLGRDVSKLEPTMQGDFPRLRYDDALKLLADKGLPLTWGEDLGAPHETALGEAFDRPVIIEAWPAQAKAFYMEPYPDDPTRVKCNDMIAPEGYGEIIGGSQRIHDYDLLVKRLEEHQLPKDAFAWYLDLRKFGSVPHAGFGLGFERTLAWLVGARHLREVIPFPRMLTRLYP
ncbi:MAG: asparagine--tRNA ligase [Trueperaceae bacterium]|nr:MAG: asparagine--tRNA ligase [Trueperaceae bacterium]